MNESTTNDNPKAPKRSKRRPAMEPLGWDEIVSQPGMGGYLSFLNGPVPLPHLQGTTPDVAIDPGAVSHPGSDENLGSKTDPGVTQHPIVFLDSVVKTTAEHTEKDPAAVVAPGSVSGLGPITTPGPLRPIAHLAPEVISIPEASASPRLRIRRCAATHDGHSLGEEVLYQALWKAALTECGDTRTIVIGWRGMSQLCRMTPKNCKINTQRLIRKLAIEILSPYNTPESIGTTYRVFSDQAILERRREAGMEWVVRSRGVDFVDPATGFSIMPICAHTHQDAIG